MLWTSIELNTRDRLRPALQAIQQGRPCEVTGGRATYDDQRESRVLPLQPGDAEKLEAFARDRERLIAELHAAQQAGFPDFDDDELAELDEYRIAVFADRLIFDAQPPIASERLDAIQAWVDGPLPDGLRALWSTCFGGELSYSLQARFPDVDQPLPLSFTELFYSDSSHYNTLEGWMQHELQLAAEVASDRGAPAPSQLSWLPFGGFEYLERMYVRTTGDDAGSVWIWRQALPPAWPDPLERDSVARMADDLPSMFALLHVDEDRLLGEHSPCIELLDFRLKELERQQPTLYAKVRRAYLSASL